MELHARHTKPVIKLARILHEKMEHLDPGSCGGSSWDELPERDMEYYCLCIEEILGNATLIIRAFADYEVILRYPGPDSKPN